MDLVVHTLGSCVEIVGSNVHIVVLSYAAHLDNRLQVFAVPYGYTSFIVACVKLLLIDGKCNIVDVGFVDICLFNLFWSTSFPEPYYAVAVAGGNYISWKVCGAINSSCKSANVVVYVGVLVIKFGLLYHAFACQ